MGGARRRVMVVAGEASGDRHAAGLVEQALAMDPGLSFEGVGGDALRASGMRILHHARDLGVVGISEVIARLPSIRAALRDLGHRIAAAPPDALLLVDFPDFNLMLARRAVEAGVPVVYFISPQLWAWRQGRIRKIKARVRRMIVLFPFEETFYRRHGVDVVLAGHPLAGDAPIRGARAAARESLGLSHPDLVFGLMPGSRLGEIERHLAPMLETARRILEREPGARFVLPVAETLPEGSLDARVTATGLPISLVRGDFIRAADACDAAVVASGTATLELACRGVPPVVVYRMSWLTWLIGRMAVRLEHVSLVNLVAGRGLVPEMIQAEFRPERAARELLELARPGPSRTQVLEGLEEVRVRLGGAGAYRRAASALLEVLDGEVETRERR